MTCKRERELRKMVEDEGITVNSIKLSGGSHYRIRITTPKGRKAVLHFASTPGDVRAVKNERSTVRKYAEGRDE